MRSKVVMIGFNVGSFKTRNVLIDETSNEVDGAESMNSIKYCLIKSIGASVKSSSANNFSSSSSGPTVLPCCHVSK